MLGQQLHNLLFDQPAQPAAPLDPAMQQQQLAAQQLNNSGNYLLKKNDYAGAINEFEQALAIEPNDQDILHNLKGQNRRNGMPSWPDKPTAR
jgi:tetratricopeptide (TPR) repeat protein